MQVCRHSCKASESCLLSWKILVILASTNTFLMIWFMSWMVWSSLFWSSWQQSMRKVFLELLSCSISTNPPFLKLPSRSTPRTLLYKMHFPYRNNDFQSQISTDSPSASYACYCCKIQSYADRSNLDWYLQLQRCGLSSWNQLLRGRTSCSMGKKRKLQPLPTSKGLTWFIKLPLLTLSFLDRQLNIQFQFVTLPPSDCKKATAQFVIQSRVGSSLTFSAMSWSALPLRTYRNAVKLSFFSLSTWLRGGMWLLGQSILNSLFLIVTSSTFYWVQLRICLYSCLQHSMIYGSGARLKMKFCCLVSKGGITRDLRQQLGYVPSQMQLVRCENLILVMSLLKPTLVYSLSSTYSVRLAYLQTFSMSCMNSLKSVLCISLRTSSLFKRYALSYSRVQVVCVWNQQRLMQVLGPFLAFFWQNQVS